MDQQLFAVAAPGLEAVVAAELHSLGYAGTPDVGGVRFTAPLEALVPLNRQLGTASRVLVRFATFKVVHLSELARACKKLPWTQVLKPGAAVRVRATCRKSKIYHSGAAAQRVLEGIAHQVEVTPVQGDGQEPERGVQEILVRLENNVCTVSLNSSGEHLHRRGFKVETAKAPLRESLAAGLLRLCHWTPDEPLIDPMCGSGTFPIEAALRAAHVAPGYARTFACQAWPVLRKGRTVQNAPAPDPAATRIFAYDRDAGAVASTMRNAERAGVAGWITTNAQALARLQAPAVDKPGLVICNPPWGERVGDRRTLRNLYATLGRIMQTTLIGWRLALVTSQPTLAHATGLTFEEVSDPLLHGGIRIRLYCTQTKHPCVA